MVQKMKASGSALRGSAAQARCGAAIETRAGVTTNACRETTWKGRVGAGWGCAERGWVRERSSSYC